MGIDSSRQRRYYLCTREFGLKLLAETATKEPLSSCARCQELHARVAGGRHLSVFEFLLLGLNIYIPIVVPIPVITIPSSSFIYLDPRVPV